MNSELTYQILKHIFNNLGISNQKIDTNNYYCIFDDKFILKDKISFELDDNSIIQNNCYGCQINIDGKLLKILGVLSNDSEYAILISLDDAPTYGAILDEERGFIAVSLDNSSFMPCNIYLQATFLAAMERLKDINVVPIPCLEYDKQLKRLISFIDFYSKFEESN